MIDEADPPIPRSGRLILLTVGAVVVLLGWILFVQLHGTGADSIHSTATLPERFTVCGRSWHGPGGATSLAEIRARDGIEPAIVDTAPLSPCPASVHPAPLQMATVVYVRVAADRYVAYELVGGP
jgi:hypothetical protein